MSRVLKTQVLQFLAVEAARKKKEQQQEKDALVAQRQEATR